MEEQVERDITCLNFEKNFPKIKTILKNCDFISFDAEFTGISSDVVLKNSLFDSSKQRYMTVRHNIKDFIISQFGITSFCSNRDTNTYEAHTFVFYVFPRTDGSLQRTFLIQSSAFQFLSSYNFDFNKFIKNGIDYSNNSVKLTQDHSGFSRQSCRTNGPILKRWDQDQGQGSPLTSLDEDVIQDELKRISQWLKTKEKEDETLDCVVYSTNTRLMDVLKEQIRLKFPRLRIITSGSQLLYCLQDEDAQNVGFSRLFKLLIELKKPLVGHNPILDLMLMYHQFYEPLPEKYEKYKRDLHNLFPAIFDTKCISYELREMLSREAMWESNDLSLLYKYFLNGIGKSLVLYSPNIVLKSGDIPHKGSEIIHESGWDSYYTGYCFIRLMHFFATSSNKGCGMDDKALTSVQHLYSVRAFKNQINITRANVSHMCLDGPDPRSAKPRWLVVESTANRPVDFEDIQNYIHDCTKITSIDVKPISRYQILVAVNSANAVRDLFKIYSTNKNFRIQTYNSFKHSGVVRGFLWACLVTSCFSLATAFVLRKQSV